MSSLQSAVLDVGCGRMPYKSVILAPPSKASRYIGLDLAGNTFGKPDIEWDGTTIPLADNSVSGVIATEVLDDCPDVANVLREIFRVLEPGGLFFLTAPDQDNLKETLLRPAELAGYAFEDPWIVDDMMQAATSRGALPLLSFAASRLWEAPRTMSP